jgi:hypothetical protein
MERTGLHHRAAWTSSLLDLQEVIKQLLCQSKDGCTLPEISALARMRPDTPLVPSARENCWSGKVEKHFPHCGSQGVRSGMAKFWNCRQVAENATTVSLLPFCERQKTRLAAFCTRGGRNPALATELQFAHSVQLHGKNE